MPVLRTLLDILGDRETQKILIRLAINKEIRIDELRDKFGITFESIIFTIDYLREQGIITKKNGHKFVIARSKKAGLFVQWYMDMIREDIAIQLYSIEKLLNNTDIDKNTFDSFLDDFDSMLKLYSPVIDNEFPDQLNKILLKIKKINKKMLSKS